MCFFQSLPYPTKITEIDNYRTDCNKNSFSVQFIQKFDVDSTSILIPLLSVSQLIPLQFNWLLIQHDSSRYGLFSLSKYTLIQFEANEYQHFQRYNDDKN